MSNKIISSEMDETKAKWTGWLWSRPLSFGLVHFIEKCPYPVVRPVKNEICGVN